MGSCNSEIGTSVFFFNVVKYFGIKVFDGDRWVCQEEWPSPLYRHYYTLALMTLQYFAPLAVLLYTYTRIAVVIWGKRTPGEAENLRDQRLARAKRKVGWKRMPPARGQARTGKVRVHRKIKTQIFFLCDKGVSRSWCECERERFKGPRH